MKGIRVLIVDDEESFAELLGKRLEARGLTVETANSGPRAIEKATGHEFDVTVLDLAMPGMDGIETLIRLRELDPDLQAILLTGHGTIQRGVEAIKLGAIDFLEKPADWSQLLELIQEAKRRKTASAKKRAEGQITDVIARKGW